MTPETQHSILLDKPREVDIVRIEQELTALWKDAAEPASGSHSSPVVRACSLNFVVVTENERQLEELSELVGEVTVEHPSRMFLIVADRGKGTPSLETWISARCSLPTPGGKQVCCEQINLITTGTDANRIPSIVTSLLVPDVPTVLLWAMKVQRDDALLSAIIPVTDRVLIDSSAEESPDSMFLAWKDYVQREAYRSSFGDLGWTHLTPWRTALAHVFQPPDRRLLLYQIDTITITYSITTDPRHSGLSQSFLLAAWFAQRLNWVLIHPLKKGKTGGFAMKMRYNEQAVNILIETAPSRPDKPGAIESVTLHTVNGDAVSVRSLDDTSFACVRTMHGDTTEERIATSRHTSESMIIAEELEVLHRDELYESVLSTLQMFLAG